MNKKKKGFTLVELLVVIAILAILAAVSVVGYLSFTKKANLSNDQTTIKMINDNLQANFIEEKPKSASEAMVGLENLNITKEKLVAYSNDYHYAYDLKNNSFVLLDDNDNIVYPENANQNKEDIWGLYMGNISDSVGLQNYVSFLPINNLEAINALANNVNNLNIDLNNFYFEADNYNNNATITLLNGFYISDTENEKIIIDEKNNVDTKNEAIKPDQSNRINLQNKTHYENVVFDCSTSGGSINLKEDVTTTFKNCLFIGGKAQGTLGNITIYTGNWSNDPFKNQELILDGCMINNTTWLQTPLINVTVKNSTFTNVAGGLNLQRPTLSANIENNIFNILGNHTENKATAIMLSPESIFDEEGNYVDELYEGGYHLNFINNEINNSKAIVRLHSCAYNNNQNYKSIIPDQLNFSNNKINNLVGSLVEDWQLTPTTNEEVKTLMSAIAEKIK